jgi:nicotinamide-nucleotide amidase
MNDAHPHPHTHAHLLSTGDELVLGQLQDSNARWMAQRLSLRGIRVRAMATVGDDLTDLVRELQRLCAGAPLVILSGGLGPTEGDLTRAALCQLTGDTLLRDQQQVAILTEKLARRGRTVSPAQLRQCDRPARATCLPNARGTAPGLILTQGACTVIALPGPPGELQPMWEDSVEPALRPAGAVVTRLLYVAGLPEADCATRLKDLTARDRTPLVGMTASGGIITVRLRYEGPDRAAGEALVSADESAVTARLGACVLAGGEGTSTHSTRVLAGELIAQLRTRAETIALAESCTGGLLGATLTDVPGSSGALRGGVVAYTNELKRDVLGVPARTLHDEGAVSAPVALHMAQGCAALAGSTWGVGVTGIAGPGGGTDAKPVGTVWLALHGPTGAQARRFVFPGGRDDVRARAVTTALAWLLLALRQGGPAHAQALLWEQA